MSQAVIASNSSLKVNRAISGATTVNANCYAVVSYTVSQVVPPGGFNYNGGGPDPFTRYFGPGQSVPSSFGSVVAGNGNPELTVYAYYGISSGVEFINSP